MKRFICFSFFLSSIFIVLSSFFHIPSSILHAQDFNYARAYQDYLYSFSQYRSAYLNYQSAKSEYQTYQTLTAQTKAIDMTKTMLTARTETLRTFLTAVRMKLNDDQNVSVYQKNLLFTKLDEEISLLIQNKTEIAPVSTIDDMLNVSQKFEKNYPVAVYLTYQTKGTLWAGRINASINEVKSEITNLENNIKQMRETGKDVSTLERWLIQAKGKEQLAEEKYNSGDKIISTMTIQNSPEEMLKILNNSQQIFEDSNQYLKETITNLKEIINGVKNV